MIDLQYIRQFFPTTVANNPNFNKQMLKEYLQLMILEHLSHTDYASKVAFIGGTNLRLIRHIDRFSEDLDSIFIQESNNVRSYKDKILYRHYWGLILFHLPLLYHMCAKKLYNYLGILLHNIALSATTKTNPFFSLLYHFFAQNGNPQYRQK